MSYLWEICNLPHSLMPKNIWAFTLYLALTKSAYLYRYSAFCKSITAIADIQDLLESCNQK